MFSEDWDDISIDTVIRAIENEYAEGKQLEFKRQQNPEDRGHKQTTVGEVVSFANAAGGDLVIGLADEDGVASSLWPVAYDDIDEVVLQWVDIIKRNTDPELPQHLVDIQALEVTEEHQEFVHDRSPSNFGQVLVLRVQRSWRAPHRETLKHHFYERSAGGKTPLDTGAIRQAMLRGEVVLERAQEFRDDRLSAIQADDVAVPLLQSPKVVLHVVPTNAFSIEGTLNPSSAQPQHGSEDTAIPKALHPSGILPAYSRFTEDGFLMGSRYEQYENRFGGYTLTFRSGVIEAVTTSSVPNDGEYVNSNHVRNCLQAALPTYIEFLFEEEAVAPYYFFLSILGAKGFPVATRRTSGREHDDLEKIDRNVARLPAAQLEDPNADIEDLVDDLLDSLYNVSGRASEPQVEY